MLTLKVPITIAADYIEKKNLLHFSEKIRLDILCESFDQQMYLTMDLSSSTQHHLPAIYTQIETAADAIHMKCQASRLFVNDENTYIIQVFYYGFHELKSASFTLETPITTAVVFRLKPVYFLTISL